MRLFYRFQSLRLKSKVKIPLLVGLSCFLTFGLYTHPTLADGDEAFELTILLSAFGAFGGMLALNGLPKMFNPLFRSDRFRRATADRFFISIEARDRRFDAPANARFLRDIGANAIEVIEE